MSATDTEYLVMLTVMTSSGMQMTVTRTVQVAAGSTRAGLLRYALSQLPEHVGEGVTLFFYAEPNALNGGAS